MRADVTLLDGRPASCSYDVDDHGFILLGLHNAAGDITSISEEEYDNVEAQVLKVRNANPDPS